MNELDKKRLDEIASYINSLEPIADNDCRTAISSGELFKEAKDILPHGVFLLWIRVKCSVKYSRVRSYMRLAKEYGMGARMRNTKSNLTTEEINRKFAELFCDCIGEKE